MERNMKQLVIAVAIAGIGVSCVEHREIRNGLRDESTYLTKTDLTNVNPKLTAEEDEEITETGWIHRVNVVAVSSPNIIETFPGYEGPVRYVDFRFREDALQVIDARHVQADEGEDPYVAERVIVEFAGEHVDVKLRESLDGERTNWLEENTERPWQERQSFKVDFENATMDPADVMSFIEGYYARACAVQTSSRLQPDSFIWDQEDQYLSFNIEVQYRIDGNKWLCYYWPFLYSSSEPVETGSVVYKYNFFRRGDSDYEPEFIEEKDPVNQRYGVFQLYNLFQDATSGLLGVKQLAMKWDPNRTDPAVFYFGAGFPDEFKPWFTDSETGIADKTNALLEDAGASLRFEFRERPEGEALEACVAECTDGGTNERACQARCAPEPGDIRFAFVNWYNNQNANGPIGYGPPTADPRTGEIFSAGLNMYNYPYDIFRFYTEEFIRDANSCQACDPDSDPNCSVLAANGNKSSTYAGESEGFADACRLRSATCAYRSEDAGGSTTQFCEAEIDLEGSCEPGQLLAPIDDTARYDSALFDQMRFVMDLPEDKFTGTASDFLPEWTGGEQVAADFHRILPEARYGYPSWNPYVGMGGQGQQPALDRFEQMIETEVEYQQAMVDIAMGENPFNGLPLHTRAGIEAQNEFLQKFRKWKKNHEDLQAMRQTIRGQQNIYEFDPGDFLGSLRNSARLCKDDGTWETDEEFATRHMHGQVHHVMWHEFGHNISLRHNFYGSMDEKHMREGEISAAVMDYIHLEAEAGAKHQWGVYDERAIQWIYGTEEKREELMAPEMDTLYCTDQHRILSPLCQAYDYGTTPSQIVLNAIDDYDWGYEFRNRRAFRDFWTVSSYANAAYGGVFPIQRMWYLSIFDWGGGGVQEILKTLDQTEGKEISTEAEYDERSVDIYNDLVAANMLMTAYYDAIINQSASFRNYQSEFDPFYGDVRRIGIINDKLFATFAFMDLQDVVYSPNISTYVAMYDAPFGSQTAFLSQRVLDNMLGANYDTFPWFRYYAMNIFAYVTNSNLVGSADLKERIAIWRFANMEDLLERFPSGDFTDAGRPDNPQQVFSSGGQEYVYTYLPDRSWHLVSSKSRSPVSYQFMRDYNESLNGTASTSLDSYGLKILLAYHEYYNNFVGF